MKMMKFVLLAFPVLLLVCTVFGEEQQFMIPPFLLGAPESDVKEMKELFQRYANKPDSQLEAALEEWVNGKGGMIKEKYNQFKANMQLMHEKAALLRKAMAENLSPEAKKADADLSSIGKDKTLSEQQKKEKFKEYLRSNYFLITKSNLNYKMNFQFIRIA
ncbi:hypothetical protein WUBG_05888 [Wuchereria bancrofti]|uniref:SXP/RAL-2 family protein Ani s 5-like cation-binding domain-containing protein n=1 Tax=Wuchereria bancrofti TaxID=6293 RepID=J9EL55_WUCBA|nr:hypothetical protein WUBG_05888 [Wuchereria bancrofti]